MKRLLLISPFLILLLIITTGLVALYQHNKSSSIAAKLESGEEIIVPQFSLPELNNSSENFSNQDLQGKYSLINVFASWCVSCVAEHDLLMQLARTNKINIYGVAWRDINENTKDYLAKNGNPYLKIGADNKGIFSKLLSVSGTPESFLIDPQGRVIYYWRGAIDRDVILRLSSG
ncbi:MAG: redoxin family protein [Pseudomonadota bacterium]